MLSLVRRSNSKADSPTRKIVVICPSGQRLVFVVADVRGNRVQINIDAPRDYIVNRGEIQVELDEQQSTHAPV